VKETRVGRASGATGLEGVRAAACGGAHTFAVLGVDAPGGGGGGGAAAEEEETVLLAWGSNAFGQLGVDDARAARPGNALGTHGARAAGAGAGSESLVGTAYVGRPARCRVAGGRLAAAGAVSCGASHTLFLLASGAVAACGRGDYGQLGHGALASEPRPRALRAFGPGSGTLVARVAAGAEHSLAVDRQQNLWAWGPPRALPTPPCGAARRRGRVRRRVELARADRLLRAGRRRCLRGHRGAGAARARGRAAAGGGGVGRVHALCRALRRRVLDVWQGLLAGARGQR